MKNTDEEYSVLLAIRAGASLESLLAKGYTYSQIALLIGRLQEIGALVRNDQGGLALTDVGRSLVASAPTAIKSGANVFIAYADKHRVKRLDTNFIYVPNRKDSPFFRAQERQNSATKVAGLAIRQSKEI